MALKRRDRRDVKVSKEKIIKNLAYQIFDHYMVYEIDLKRVSEDFFKDKLGGPKALAYTFSAKKEPNQDISMEKYTLSKLDALTIYILNAGKVETEVSLYSRELFRYFFNHWYRFRKFEPRWELSDYQSIWNLASMHVANRTLVELFRLWDKNGKAKYKLPPGVFFGFKDIPNDEELPVENVYKYIRDKWDKHLEEKLKQPRSCPHCGRPDKDFNDKIQRQDELSKMMNDLDKLHQKLSKGKPLTKEEQDRLNEIADKQKQFFNNIKENLKKQIDNLQNKINELEQQKEQEFKQYQQQQNNSQQNNQPESCPHCGNPIQSNEQDENSQQSNSQQNNNDNSQQQQGQQDQGNQNQQQDQDTQTGKQKQQGQSNQNGNESQQGQGNQQQDQGNSCPHCGNSISKIQKSIQQSNSSGSKCNINGNSNNKSFGDNGEPSSSQSNDLNNLSPSDMQSGHNVNDGQLGSDSMQNSSPSSMDGDLSLSNNYNFKPSMSKDKSASGDNFKFSGDEELQNLYSELSNLTSQLNELNKKLSSTETSDIRPEESTRDMLDDMQDEYSRNKNDMLDKLRNNKSCSSCGNTNNNLQQSNDNNLDIQIDVYTKGSDPINSQKSSLEDLIDQYKPNINEEAIESLTDDSTNSHVQQNKSDSKIIRKRFEEISKEIGSGTASCFSDFEFMDIDTGLLMNELKRNMESIMNGYEDASYLAPDMENSLHLSYLTNKNLLLPSLVNRDTGPILIVLDISGSISIEEMSTFLTMCHDLAVQKERTLHVYTCTDQIVDRFENLSKRNIENLKVTDSGGTDLRPAILEMLKKYPQAQNMLILTDTETPWPSEKELNFKVKYFICISKLAYRQYKNFELPWATTMFF